jgi:dienelactone hydrolase
LLRVGPGEPVAAIDAEDGVRVNGAAPGERVVVRATVELCGQAWTCTGEFVADASGRVDTTRDPSVGGDYLGVDALGLYWSARTAGFYDWLRLSPMRVTMRTTAAEQTAEAAYERRWLPDGATYRDVSEDGVIGRVFLPPHADGAPGLVILSGSNGGLGGPSAAALLTGYGVATLALAHWSYPGTPDRLRDIPIEVVGRGCDWLRGQPGVADRPPTVMGISRGGELALLAGAYLPDRVGHVISDVGSGVPWGAWGPDTDVNETAWTFQGRPIQQIREDEDDPYRWVDDPDAVARAEIPVERCSGRVLLLSADDDQVWPSTRLSEIAQQRAVRHGAGDRVEHVVHRGAGHGSGAPPGYPIQEGTVGEGDGGSFSFGGTRAANQAARRESWRRLIELVTS